MRHPQRSRALVRGLGALGVLGVLGGALWLGVLLAPSDPGTPGRALPGVAAAPPPHAATTRPDAGEPSPTPSRADDETGPEGVDLAASRSAERELAPYERWVGSSRRTGPNLLSGGRIGEIHLETPETVAGSLGASLEGLDTAGPRRLEIWQETEDGAFVRVGEGESDEVGALDLPQQMPTSEDREIWISPAGAGPEAFERSQPRTLSRGYVRPPTLLRGPPGEGASSLRVVAGESSGTVLLQTASGRPIALLEIPTLPDPRRGIFDLDLELRPGETVLAAHQLPNGDLSRTVVHRIEAPAATPTTSGLGSILEELAP